MGRHESFDPLGGSPSDDLGAIAWDDRLLDEIAAAAALPAQSRRSDLDASDPSDDDLFGDAGPYLPVQADRSGDDADLPGDPLTQLLMQWRGDLRVDDLPPVPELPAVAAPARIRKQRRGFRPMIAVAAAIAALLVGTATVGSRTAHPGDVLWPLAKMLWSDRADSVAARESARIALDTAETALYSGDPTRAIVALTSASGDLQRVQEEDGRQELETKYQDLWTKATSSIASTTEVDGGPAGTPTVPVPGGGGTSGVVTPGAPTTGSTPPPGTGVNVPPGSPAGPGTDPGSGGTDPGTGGGEPPTGPTDPGTPPGGGTSPAPGTGGTSPTGPTQNPPATTPPPAPSTTPDTGSGSTPPSSGSESGSSTPPSSSSESGSGSSTPPSTSSETPPVTDSPAVSATEQQPTQQQPTQQQPTQQQPTQQQPTQQQTGPVQQDAQQDSTPGVQHSSSALQVAPAGSGTTLAQQSVQSEQAVQQRTAAAGTDAVSTGTSTGDSASR
ncbi:hypothetical protein GIS00_10285 [Nakamurella sp. YIM 132087]|uniref:Anti-sigma-D factor RsdA sigma factor binding region domain-containing protein n=1 Tax=Nakamurella alba TaxID=2665158 RepID=A0A7K1FJT1_9ACTN|nr:hypothetical protein [Nakamurella alba]MTD14336.1 hypothetical protein [Nakamurella alba]